MNIALCRLCRLATADFFRMQAPQRLPVRPFQVSIVAFQHGGYPCLRLPYGFSNGGLRQTGGLDFFDESFPVHARIISILF